MKARVIGMGGWTAGDDAVGLEVARRLQGCGLDVEILETDDPTRLVDMLACSLPVIVVDAVVGPLDSTAVHWLDADELKRSSAVPLSSHGMSVSTALELARILHVDAVAPRIRILGLPISSAARGTSGLSPAAAALVEPAVEAIRSALSGEGEM